MKISWREECAVFGIWGAGRRGELSHLGLHALQHRGQESTGIVTARRRPLPHREGARPGRPTFFTPERLPRLPGAPAIGHNRYSTTGSLTLENAQPLTGVSRRPSWSRSRTTATW